MPMLASDGAEGVSRPAPPRTRTHPLATASVGLSALGFAPLVIVGGLLGAACGVAARLAIRREPQRWGGGSRADAGIGLGMVSGVLFLATFGLVRADDWGWAPFVAAVAYGAVVCGLAAYARRETGTGVKAAGAGVAGAAGVLVVLAIAVGTVVGVVALLKLMIQELAEG
jgi:hypothetical protein